MTDLDNRKEAIIKKDHRWVFRFSGFLAQDFAKIHKLRARGNHNFKALVGDVDRAGKSGFILVAH
jgi:hypothetical protein